MKSKELKERFDQAHLSLEQLAQELEFDQSVAKLDSDEVDRLKVVIDRVRKILWQVQQKLG